MVGVLGLSQGDLRPNMLFGGRVRRKNHPSMGIKTFRSACLTVTDLW